MPRAAKTAATRARSLLERDALSHPAFVHHTADAVLDHVTTGLIDANREVPLGSPDIAYRARVFSSMAILLEVHCCLCGSTRKGQAFRSSLPFCKWLCGDFDGTCISGFPTHPLCNACTTKIVIFSGRNNGTGWGSSCQPVVHEVQFPQLLCVFYADRDFKRSVAKNADSWRRLRFDPRQPDNRRAA